jgi:Rrf2 family protein
MKFTAKERTGLRAMAEFARRYGHGPVALSEVAQEQDLSQPYLEQIVGHLRRAGLLLSTRGAHGGYMLAKAPAAIGVGEILRAVEGSLMNVTCTCTSGSPSCTREPVCATRNVWQIVALRLSETLDNTSLADILGQDGQVL